MLINANPTKSIKVHQVINKYSLWQKKQTFDSKFFVAPLGEKGQKFTWLIM